MHGSCNSVERQETRYLYESAVNGAWQTAVVYPDSTDTLSQGADGAWSITGGTDHVAIAHDRLGRAVATTDQRGVERVFLYDSAGRLTLDHAAGLGDAGQNVDGAVRAFETLYDDLGRVRSSTSLGYDQLDEPTVALNEVRYRYDGWGNLAQEWQAHDGEVDTQTTPSVEYVYDDGASGGVAAYVRLHEAIYPNGRTLAYGYGPAEGADDVLSRIATIATGQDVHAQYAYLGLGTVVEEAFTEPEVRLNYDTGGDDSLSGFDRFGRVVDQVWEQYGGQQPAAVDRFQYGYDSAGNRVWRKNVVAGTLDPRVDLDELYTYDSMYRLIAGTRGNLVDGQNGKEIADAVFAQDWGLDGTGNWAAFNEDLDGAGWDLQQARQHNEANEVTGATDWAAPAHDRAGNMTAMPKPAAPADALGATYDAWNRLVEVSEGGVLIAKFSYDAAGRRILQQLADAQEPDQYIHYYHSRSQVVETRAADDSAGVPDPAQLDPAYQFIWSPRYIDALILRDQYDAQGQLDPGARLFYLADANHNVTALLGPVETEPDVFEWQVVERYVYSPYGDATIYTPDWSSLLAESAFGNTTLYTGREFDPATGLYYYRARYYHAQLGRFISRDPIGYDAGDVNLYRYVGGRATMLVDPSGLVGQWSPRDRAPVPPLPIDLPVPMLPARPVPRPPIPAHSLDGYPRPREPAPWVPMDFPVPAPPHTSQEPDFRGSNVPLPLGQRLLRGIWMWPKSRIIAGTHPRRLDSTRVSITWRDPYPSMGRHFVWSKSKIGPATVVGAGGCASCVGVIILTPPPDDKIYAFHFDPAEDYAIATLDRHKFPHGSTAAVYGGDESGASRHLLCDVMVYLLLWPSTFTSVSYNDVGEMWVDPDGTFYGPRH